MSTSTITRALRETESVCPPRRAGHDETYQSWKDAGDGAQSREHTSESATVCAVSVARNQSEYLCSDARQKLDCAEVWVDVDVPGGVCLSANAAMRLAKGLLVDAEAVALQHQAQQ